MQGHHPSPLGEPMHFTEVILRNMGERSLTGADMTRRPLYHQSHPALVTARKSWGTWTILHSLQAAQGLESVLSRWLVGISLFQAVPLVWESLLAVLTASYMLGEEGI